MHCKQAACRSASPYPHLTGQTTQEAAGVKGGRGALELSSHSAEFGWLVMTTAAKRQEACCYHVGFNGH